MPLKRKEIDQNEVAISHVVKMLGGYKRAAASFERPLLVSLRLGKRQVMTFERHIVRFLNSGDQGKKLQIDDLGDITGAYVEYQCAWQIFRYDHESDELVISPEPSGAREPYELRLLIKE